MSKPSHQKSSKAILLVEDNPEDVLFTLRAFQQIDPKAEVAVASDGAAALDYLFGTGPHVGGSPALPQLVLLDLQLPKLNGLEVLDRIRTDPRTRHLPVVALTSSLKERDLTASYLGGANSCVRKPLGFSEFAELLRQIWHYWSCVNAMPLPVETNATQEAVA